MMQHDVIIVVLLPGMLMVLLLPLFAGNKGGRRRWR